MLSDRYLHPNGQIPADEWNFGDVNPPVHAMAAIKVFRAERVQRGAGDHNFLQRVFHKLLLNFAWWINRKDADGHNLFEGGFLGLDNISVYDRSKPLPPGYRLQQADATGWMAHFSLKMTLITLELCVKDPDYEEIAIHCYKQFLAIAEAIAGGEETGAPSLWDPDIGFFTDLLTTPREGTHRIEVYSWVGLIPLFAVEIVNQDMLAHAPRFAALLNEHKGGLFRGSRVCACPDWENERGERLLALVDHRMLPRILYRFQHDHQVPALDGHYPDNADGHWKDLFWFYEYFHADSGTGLGASHQTGWTGLLANLVMRRYQKDIRPWSGLDAGDKAALIDEIA